MLLLLALPVFGAVALAYRYLQLYAPSNMLIRRIRSAPPRWRAVPSLLALAVALLIAMHVVSEAIGHGAPGWLNLVVLVLAWDAIKIGLLAFLTAVRAAFEAIRAAAERSTITSRRPPASAGRLVGRTRVRETVGHAPR